MRIGVMSENRLVLEVESRGGARYVTLVRADGRRTPTDVLAHPEAVAAFNASPLGAAAMPRDAHELYLALLQEVQSEHWKGSAADRSWALHALHAMSGAFA
jgi:hypothetical protein